MWAGASTGKLKITRSLCSDLWLFSIDLALFCYFLYILLILGLTVLIIDFIASGLEAPGPV